METGAYPSKEQFRETSADRLNDRAAGLSDCDALTYDGITRRIAGDVIDTGGSLMDEQPPADVPSPEPPPAEPIVVEFRPDLVEAPPEVIEPPADVIETHYVGSES
jgi:hypothetical protein